MKVNKAIHRKIATQKEIQIIRLLRQTIIEFAPDVLKLIKDERLRERIKMIVKYCKEQ